MKTLIFCIMLLITIASCESESGRRAKAMANAPVRTKAVIIEVTYDIKEGMYYTKVKSLDTHTVKWIYMRDKFNKQDTIMSN